MYVILLSHLSNWIWGLKVQNILYNGGQTEGSCPFRGANYINFQTKQINLLRKFYHVEHFEITSAVL